MDSERCQLLCEGFLDIKYPPDSPERVLQKAWRRLWASATILYPRTRGEPHLVLQFRKGPDEKRLHIVKASRDGLRLFRCRSKSRPLRTWALSSGSSLLIYLAAATEYETQKWMQTLRDGLWPPIHNLPENTYEVSLIDNEKTFSTGLLGLYGRLIRTSDGVVSIIHPHWQGMLLRWKQEDVEDVRLVRKVCDEESSTAGVFQITLRSPGLKTRSLNFYSNTAASATEWIRSVSQNMENLETNDSQKITESSILHVEQSKNEVVNNSDPEYAKICKGSKQLEVIEENATIEICNGIDDEPESNVQPRNLLSTNISSDLLNASISSIRPARKSLEEDSESKSEVEENDSDDSLTDIYEHVYEDLPPRTTSVGRCTLYEEIEDLDNEYVPPLPPQLPNRPLQKPTSLRLLKLSESVAEALKLAEEVPIKEEQHHASFLKKVVGKCKSLQASPLKEIASASFEEQPVLKRTLSEPDVATSLPSEETWFPDAMERRKTSEDILSNAQQKEESIGKNTAKQYQNIISKQNNESIINPTPSSHLLHNSVADSIKNVTKCVSKEMEGDYIDMR